MCNELVVKSVEIEPEDRINAHFKVESIKIESKGGDTEKEKEREEVAEVLVGDEEGCLKLFLKGKQQVEQAEKLKQGDSVSLTNCLASVVGGFIRLEQDSLAAITLALKQHTLPQDLQVNINNNLSLVEYELVDSEKDSEEEVGEKGGNKQQRRGGPPIRPLASGAANQMQVPQEWEE